MTINLIDARRGLHDKCLELFSDKKIAEQIYCYLCDGIEDCEIVEAEPVRHGRWICCKGSNGKDYRKCSECLHTQDITGLLNYCPNCGARMNEVEK